MATRADHQKLLSPAQIQRAIRDAGGKRLEDLKSRISGAPEQGFVAQIRDDVERAGRKASRVSVRDLEPLVARELVKIQRAASVSDGVVDLGAVQRNFGSFAARLLKLLHTRTEGKQARPARGIHRTERIEQHGPRAKPGGLRSFTSYFTRHAGALPEEGKTRIPYGFTIEQVRWFFREYWGGPPYMSQEELCARAMGDPLFKGHGRIEPQHVKYLFREFKDSFPWPLSTRNAVYGSYLLVDRMLRAPKGTSRRQVIAELDRTFEGRFPDATAFNNYLTRSWPRQPELYPFLDGLPRDSSGRVILEAQGDVDPFATDPAGRLSLTPELAAEVKKLAFDERVRYGWTLDDLIDFVKEETGCASFQRRTFQKLRWEMVKVRKAKPEDAHYIPDWDEIRDRARARLAERVREIRSEPGHEALRRHEILQILNDEIGKGERPYTEAQLEALQSAGEVGSSFRAATADHTDREVSRLLAAWKERRTGERQIDVAHRLGLTDRGRIDLLFRKARAKEPGAFLTVGRAHGSFSAKDDEILRLAMDRLPIGGSQEDLHHLIARDFPDFIERHPVKRPDATGNRALQRLGIDEGWVTHQHTRLAHALLTVSQELGPRRTYAEIVGETMQRYPIAYDADTVRTAPYEWKKDPERYVEIAKLVTEEGFFPWERPRFGVTSANMAKAFRRHYSESRRAPDIDPEGFRGLSRAQAREVHDAYWSMPPGATSEDLLAALKARPDFEHVTLEQITRLISAFPGSFPFSMQQRAVTFHSFLFVEELLRSPPSDATSEIRDRLAARHGSFPAIASLEGLASGLWVEDPKRFPFAARLPMEDGKFVLRGRANAPVFEVRGKHLAANEDIARAFKELCYDPRVRYDWDHERFLAFVSKELGVEFTPNRLLYLRRLYDLPTRSDIRDTAKRNLAALIRDLHSGAANDNQPIELIEEIFEILTKRYGYPSYDAKVLDKLRQVPADEERGLPSGRDLVPSFEAANRAKTRDAAERLLAAIRALPEGKGRYTKAGQSLGFSDNQTRHLLGVIHESRPGALPGRPDHYVDEELALLKQALQEVPVGAGIGELEAILRGQHPEFFDAHPAPAFLGLLKRIGVESWRDYMDGELRKLVAHVASRSKRGVSLKEIYQVIRDEYDLRFHSETLHRRAREWKKDPKAYPELKPAIDPVSGSFLWELKDTELTKDLAREVGAKIRSHPGKTLEEIVGLLRGDPDFRDRYPRFKLSTLVELRAEYPDLVPFMDVLRASPAAKVYHARIRALAERVKKLAEASHDQQALTPRFLARTLAEDETDVRIALRRHATMFPWSRSGSAGNIDIELAALVGHQMEGAALGTTLEQIHAHLTKDPEFRDRYPSFEEGTFTKLQEEYPDIVPNWSARQQILASRTLVHAVLTAEKGAQFDKIVEPLAGRWPESFPSREPGYYLSLWSEDKERFPFVEELRDPRTRRIQLVGRGRRVELDEAVERSKASRMAREIPLIPRDMPVTRALIAGIPKSRLKDLEVVCVQHLFGCMVPFLEIARSIGLEPDRTTVVGVPYSTNDTVVEVLSDRGWSDVRPPPLDLGVWKEMVRSALYDRLRTAQPIGRQIVVLDDGGWAATLLATDPYLREHREFFTIVEQTTRGITVADQYGEVGNPLINVAQSILKRLVEGPMIKDVLEKKLMLRLSRMGIQSVSGMRIGLLGKGAIGSPFAKALRDMGAIVTIRDPYLEEEEKKRAIAEGFVDGSDAKAFFGGQDMILGASGQQSMGEDELALVRKGTILGSCSSKLVEINMEYFKSQAVRTEIVERESRPPTLKYTLADGREITVLASGFPLNFDGDVNGIDPEKVQLTRTLMMIGLLQAVDAKAAGIRRLDVARQLELLDQIEGIEIIRKDREVMAAIATARKQLKEALTNPRAHYHRKPRPFPGRAG